MHIKLGYQLRDKPEAIKRNNIMKTLKQNANIKTLDERYAEYLNSIKGANIRVMKFPEWLSRPSDQFSK